MPLNVNPSDTPDDDSHLSTAEVPVHHMVDSDFSSDDESDDDDPNDRFYELLPTTDVANNVTEDSSSGDGQPGNYYQHNYVVEWVDWDQYEQSQQRQQQPQQSISDNPIDGQSSDETPIGIDVSIADTSPVTSEPSLSRPINLNDDRINEIKTLMADFELPKDNIPVWAHDMPEDQWKTFLERKVEDRTND
ncbi:uncharacterized protein LOC128958219 [Oppia nitens]|uniref:uncharacterized protein LOC128958219 n=1 Tax=Oppia nitens TaxID=1686743 RepID=UPI0023D9FF51|nr:uncharacterized protein LOC128958219 [Oppia nitens]